MARETRIVPVPPDELLKTLEVRRKPTTKIVPPTEFFLESLNKRAISAPEQLIPKGRERFLSRLGGFFRGAKEKLGSLTDFARKHKTTSLVLGSALARFGISRFFDLDAATFDHVVWGATAASFTLDRTSGVLAQKVRDYSGYDLNQNRAFRGFRDVLPYTTAVLAGLSVGSITDAALTNAVGNFDHPVIEAQSDVNAPQIPEISYQDPPLEIDSFQTQPATPQHREWGLPMEDYPIQEPKADIGLLPDVLTNEAVTPEVHDVRPNITDESLVIPANLQDQITLDPLPPTTTLSGRVVEGSVFSGLKSDGEEFLLFENGVNNLDKLRSFGDINFIDEEVLKRAQQKGVSLWAQGKLDSAKYPLEWASFHLGNGTESVFNELLNPKTYQLFHQSGMIR